MDLDYNASASPVFANARLSIWLSIVSKYLSLYLDLGAHNPQPQVCFGQIIVGMVPVDNW